MTQNANPLSASEPWNLVADGYAETTVLDVACGLGKELWRERKAGAGLAGRDIACA